RTVQHVIAVMESRHPHLTTQKNFYVEASRSREGFTLITDDRERLKETLERQTGERISALEVVAKNQPAEQRSQENDKHASVPKVSEIEKTDDRNQMLEKSTEKHQPEPEMEREMVHQHDMEMGR
ncbi:MAG: hypothetical protein AAF862_05100, partial [Pseudomonadota bacterium]